MRKVAPFLLLFVASLLLAQADPVSRSWNQPVEPFRIIGNVYYVGASDVTSYLITTPKGHIVIDGGFVETAPMIRRNIEQLGFRVSDVKILLSSHAHYDHVGGLAELKSATGATFYASTGDAAQLARGGLDDPQFGNRFPFPPITADRLVRDGERVTLGGTTLVARITPGHTRGCTTWTMSVGADVSVEAGASPAPAPGNVDAGASPAPPAAAEATAATLKPTPSTLKPTRATSLTVVFVGSPTVPPGYRLVGNPRYPDAIDDYRKQFAILRALKPDVFLASHGNFYELADKMKRRGGKTNPFIDPAGYRAFVHDAAARMEKVAAEQKQ